ncbi:MAG: hypothetical protein O3C34_12575, partial [Proteobacteria bacterium]|nr:hypothetical protein [Pseudomonadota bacterium]
IPTDSHQIRLMGIIRFGRNTSAHTFLIFFWDTLLRLTALSVGGKATVSEICRKMADLPKSDKSSSTEPRLLATGPTAASSRQWRSFQFALYGAN